MPLSIQKLVSRLTLRQLQVFSVVYTAKSYSKAGDILGLTQPAVSSQIRQLEAAVDAVLFEYVGRKLYCTAAGECLAQCVETLFAELRTLQHDLAALHGKVAGELNLAAVSTAQYVVPYLLKGFVAQYPAVQVNMTVVNRAEALRRLSDNSDHLVIMGIVPQDKPLSALPFLDNELIPVANAEHPFCTQSHVTLEEFLQAGLLMREAGSGSRLALELYCQQQRINLQPAMELGSNDAVKHGVLAGLGVAVLPRLSIVSELQLGSLCELPLEGFPIRRSWSAVHPKGKHPTPAMQSFLQYLQNSLTDIEAIFSAN